MKLLLLFLFAGVAHSLVCKHNGKTYNDGDTWVDGNFKMKCTASNNKWATSIVACLTAKGSEVAVGSTLVEDGRKYNCQDQGGGKVGMSWETHQTCASS
ncbi:hypothetical protein GCK32_005877 [Trichostrongylus colubriformis]|uniref:Abnormal cell migration protein 18-like fibronectin type I domain-containing protein n=1 Tax=Trichostrongylus colubriformis TaxID=6319 RepID=A0AAN8FVN3_TRICO